MDNRCPQCGSELRGREDGSSLVTECTGGCGWNVATTNPHRPSFDPQLYDVVPVVEKADRNRAIARLAVALGIPIGDARRMVDQGQPIAKGVQAIEVQRLAKFTAIWAIRRAQKPWPFARSWGE